MEAKCAFLQGHDVVLLQELGAAAAAGNVRARLPQHVVYASDHAVWRKGKGVALALRRTLARALVCPPKINNDLQLIHARLRGLLPGGALLHLICCYMLCESSQQLPKDGAAKREALAGHYAALQQLLDEITASAPRDLVVLAGDLNANGGATQALGPASLAALLALSGCGGGGPSHQSIEKYFLVCTNSKFGG